MLNPARPTPHLCCCHCRATNCCVACPCSIKAQDEPFETPMQPITMMRNSLGREEGGSGVPLNREAYEASTTYWQTHAAIVAGEEPSGE